MIDNQATDTFNESIDLNPTRWNPTHNLYYAILCSQVKQLTSQQEFECSLALLELVSRGSASLSRGFSGEILVAYDKPS